MKIAQVVCVYPPYKGGIGEVAYFYSKEILNNGYYVEIFTPKYNKDFKTLEQLDNIKINRLYPILKYGKAAVLFNLLNRLKNFDIIHLHYPFFGTAEFILLLRKISPNIKLVVTYHMDVVGQGILSKFFKFYNKQILPKLILNADKIIVSSFDYIENSVIQNLFFKNKHKFIELPFGVNYKFKKLEKIPEEFYQDYNILKNQDFILFVGALDKAHYFKGLDILLKAFSFLNKDNLKLIIIGKGELRDYYIKLAKDLKILDRVIFTGFVPDEDLVYFYNLSKMCVIPSIDKSEAFGLALLQASACGKPCITSNLAGVRKVIVDGFNGLLVEPKNIKDLVEKIDILLENKSLCVQLGQNGINLIKEKFNWNKIGKNLIELYKQIL